MMRTMKDRRTGVIGSVGENDQRMEIHSSQCCNVIRAIPQNDAAVQSDDSIDDDDRKKNETDDKKKKCGLFYSSSSCSYRPNKKRGRRTYRGRGH